MRIAAGVHELGPDDGTLAVKTGRGGGAAKAGHDLVLAVTAWHATLEVAERVTLALDADATSLRVRDATGGMKALDDDDRANIETTIDDEVLQRKGIAFRSTDARAGDDGTLHVEGELDLLGRVHPLAFALAVDDNGRLTGSATVRQSDWGIKPYSALFGALKVNDEVEVVVEATLPAS